jgi:hypothetical protein
VTPDPISIGGWIASAVAAGMAVFERIRSKRSSDHALHATERAQEAEARQSAHQEILAQKDELTRLARESAQQWKERLATEHAEFMAYREKMHAQIQDAQATILKQTEEIANLRARTDITPVMDTLKSVLEQLGKILNRLEKQERQTAAKQ